MFENKVFRKVFVAKKDEISGEWRNLRNAELNTMCYSSSIFFSVNIMVLMCSIHLYLDLYNVFNIVYFVIIFLY